MVETLTRALHPGLFESDGLLHPALALLGRYQAAAKIRTALDAIAPMVEKLLQGQREEIASMLNSYPNEFCQEVADTILERWDE